MAGGSCNGNAPIGRRLNTPVCRTCILMGVPSTLAHVALPVGSSRQNCRRRAVALCSVGCAVTGTSVRLMQPGEDR